MSGEFTSLWLADHEARMAAKGRGVAALPSDAVDREIAGLHVPIIAECKRRGWKYVHSDPTRPTTIGEGVCDFIIYADCGRMFHVECKTKTGKLTIEQLAFICWIQKLGHKVHVITAMSEFMEIVKIVNPNGGVEKSQL